ncbi:MAG: hypothetical protein ACRDY7_00115, partial [Acidimicrobiia bacterium]
AVQAVLDQREEAIGAGDRGAFLDTIDPEAPDAFRRAQGRLFDGLRTVRFSRYELVVRSDEVPDLSAGLAERYPGADDVFLPPVEGRYLIAGADEIDAVDGLFYTFLLRDGRWRIVSDSDLADLGLPSARNPWDFGPVAQLGSEHFTVLFDEADRSRARALADLAERGYGRLTRSFGRPVPTRIVLVLPHTTEELRDMIQATFDLSNFVAFAAASVDRDRGWSTTAPRVYAQDDNLAASVESYQLETMHHEFIHVAAFPLAGPFVPSWVHEGVADWLASGRPKALGVAGSDSLVPDDYEFTTGGQGSILTAYAESSSAIAFLAETEGPSAPLDLLVEAGAPRVAPGTADYHLDQAMRKVSGAGMGEFQAAWDGGA